MTIWCICHYMRNWMIHTQKWNWSEITPAFIKTDITMSQNSRYMWDVLSAVQLDGIWQCWDNMIVCCLWVVSDLLPSSTLFWLCFYPVVWNIDCDIITLTLRDMQKIWVSWELWVVIQHAVAIMAAIYSLLIFLYVGDKMFSVYIVAFSLSPWIFFISCNYHLCLNTRLSKQSWGRWFETPSHSLWHHCNYYGGLEHGNRHLNLVIILYNIDE